MLLALRNIKNVGKDEIRNGENYSVLAYAASGFQLDGEPTECYVYFGISYEPKKKVD